MNKSTTIAFLVGLLLGQILVGVAGAYSSEAWTRGDVVQVLRLLERIAER